jgi:two-component system, OmpR family, sensor histidine kinase KdpD
MRTPRKVGDVNLQRRSLRLLASVAGVAMITWIAYSLIPVNATTVGFAYLLFVLVVASTWGFLEATACSVVATGLFNFFFFEPKLTFTIADPQNWVALFSFLATWCCLAFWGNRSRPWGLIINDE